MDTSMKRPDLVPNQAVCFNCEKVLTSKDQYDMVVCLCGAMAIDGGCHLRIIELKINLDYGNGLSPMADTAFTVKF
jgi:hypothetical protein